MCYITGNYHSAVTREQGPHFCITRSVYMCGCMPSHILYIDPSPLVPSLPARAAMQVTGPYASISTCLRLQYVLCFFWVPVAFLCGLSHPLHIVCVANFSAASVYVEVHIYTERAICIVEIVPGRRSQASSRDVESFLPLLVNEPCR